MESLRGGPEDEHTTYLCPRCGTVKIEDANEAEPTVYVPKLVERCRLFHNTAILTGLTSRLADDEWLRHGVAESIWPEGSDGRMENWRR